MGYNIGERPENTIPGIDLDNFYLLAGGPGSAVINGRVLILAFADYADDDYTTFFVRLQALNTTDNIRIVGVLYDDSSGTAAVSGPNFATAVGALSGAGVTFDIINNGQWNTGPAQPYLSNGGGIGHPFAYIVSKYYDISNKLDDTSSGPSIEDAVNTLLSGPTIIANDPITTNPLNSIPSVGITYSEAVTNADTETNYTLSGTGKGSLSGNPSAAVADGVTDNKFNLTINGGSPVTGTLTITISNVTDSIFFNPVALVDTTIDYTMDVTPPTIAISAPSAATANASSTITYTVTYGGASSVLLAGGDITLNKTGDADGTVAVSGSGTTTRTVTINSISGNGTLGISIAAGTAVDAAANPAPAAGPSTAFTVDTIAPTIAISAPSAATANASSTITYTVTYGAATSVSLAGGDITLNKTGDADGTVAVSGSGTTTRTVTINSISGNGTLGISIAAGTAADAAANPAPVAGPSTTFNVVMTREAIFVLDFSSTMNAMESVPGTTSQRRIDYLQEAVEGILTAWQVNVPDNVNDQVGIIRFSSDSSVNLALSSLASLNISALTFPNPSGCTAMGSGLARAMFTMNYDSADPAKKRCIILITDGMQNVNPFVYYYDNANPESSSVLINNITIVPDVSPPGSFTCSSTDAFLPGTATDHPLVVYNNGTDPITKNNLIPIHTIGIGDSVPSGGALEDMLIAISGETYQPGVTDVESISRGLHFQETSVFPNVQDSFSNILAHLFKGNSLQIVSKYQGALEAGKLSTEETGSSPEFILNRSAKSLTVYLSWAGNAKLKLTLKKEKKTVWSFDKHKESNNYDVGFIKFPHFQITGNVVYPRKLTREKYIEAGEIPEKIMTHAESVDISAVNSAYTGNLHHVYGEYIDPEGKWEVIIEREGVEPGDDLSEIPYYLVVFADEKALDVDIRMPKVTYTSDDFIPIDIRALVDKKPLGKLISAKVTVTRPVECYANILSSEYRGKGIKPPEGSRNDVSKIARVVEQVRADKEAVQRMDRKITEILKMEPLHSSGAGNNSDHTLTEGFYRAEYNKAVVPGVYKLEFSVKGFHEATGVFKRTINRTIVVKPMPDKARSIISGGVVKKGIFNVSVTPKDKFDNLIGPGYASRFNCSLEGSKPLPGGQISDNFDGSYSIKIPELSSQDIKSKRLEIVVMEQNIFYDVPDKLRRPCWLCRLYRLLRELFS